MTTKTLSPNHQNKKKIMVVDDHPIVREGLTRLINDEEDMELCGEAGDAEEAIKKIKASSPDLIVVDISLKGLSGIELTKNILSDYPKMSVLIISMHDELVYIERVLKIGAKGYLMKQEASDNFVNAIRKVLAGEIYVSDKIKEVLMNKLVGGGNKVAGPSPTNLTDREIEVIHLIGQGLSTREIAEKLFLSVKTVDSHYANIKNKLDLKNSHELTQYAVKWSLAQVG